jgi:hypothetical protein
MILLILTFSFFFISLILNALIKEEGDVIELFTFISRGLTILLIVTSCFAWPNMYLTSKSFVKEYESVQRTVEMEAHDLENAALKHKIISINRELANYKYWNSLWITDHFYTDEVEDLKPIDFKKSQGQ